MTMVTSDGGGGGLEAIDYDNSDIQNLIKDQIAKGASPMEFKLFIEQCRYTGLNPLMGQIHCVPRYDGNLKRNVFKAQTGIDGFRLIAKRSHEYAGQDEPEWCGADGQWTDVWLASVPPTAARIRVYHHDYARPIVGIVMWDEFVPMIKVYGEDKKPKRDANGAQMWRVTPMWKDKPAHMLAKCAEAQALRKAFPNELSGLYTDDEMARADADARRAQRRAEKRGTTSTPAPVVHEDGEERSAPVTVVVDQDEELADADALAKFRANLSELGRTDPAMGNRLLEAWRESGVKPHGAITTAADFAEAKAFVKDWLTTKADITNDDDELDDDTDESDEDVDPATGEIREPGTTDEGVDENKTETPDVVRSPESTPETPVDQPKTDAKEVDDKSTKMINDSQHRKIRSMFSKALVRGDARGDVHDYAAALVGMHALKSLKELTSDEASKVIQSLVELEQGYEQREAAKRALSAFED